MNIIEGINKCISNIDHSLESLQKKLWIELEEIILHEDLLWAQKARCEWFTLGIEIPNTSMGRLMLIRSGIELMHC